jgi:hypothetical protein
MTSAPFNANSVADGRFKDSAEAGRRFPFGLPRTGNACRRAEDSLLCQ